METSDIRVLLADDHVLVRAGLRVLLQSLGGIQVVAEAGSGDEAIEATQRHQPDVVLMDIAMPGLNGLDAAVRILKQSPHIHLIILSMYTNEDYVRQALSVGVSGYLQKGADPAELELAIKAVMRNEVYLTPAVSKQLVQEYLHGGNKPVAVHELTPRQREILKLEDFPTCRFHQDSRHARRPLRAKSGRSRHPFPALRPLCGLQTRQVQSFVDRKAAAIGQTSPSGQISCRGTRPASA